MLFSIDLPDEIVDALDRCVQISRTKRNAKNLFDNLNDLLTERGQKVLGKQLLIEGTSRSQVLLSVLKVFFEKGDFSLFRGKLEALHVEPDPRDTALQELKKRQKSVKV
jgi:hypothetical protein